jgi:hypothetical protein
MTIASAEEIAELLGERADESVVERVAVLSVSLDEVAEAVDDLDYEARYGEPRLATTAKIDEIRQILEELVPPEDITTEAEAEDEEAHEGLTVVDAGERAGG